MNTFTRSILSFIVITMLVSVILAEDKTDYEQIVDAVVQKYVGGQELNADEIDILSKIITSKNKRYFEVYRSYKFAKENDLQQDELKIEQYVKAIGLRVQRELKSDISKTTKNNNVSVTEFNENTDVPGGDAGGGLVSAVDATWAIDRIVGDQDLPDNDFDVYKINIADPNNFSVFLQTDFDPMIFLFDSDGYLVSLNDDSPVNPYDQIRWLDSGIPVGDPYGPKEAGIYYFAIGGFWTEPLDAAGDWMFDDCEYSANWVAPGNGNGPFDHWVDTDGVQGNYTAYFTGLREPVILPPPTIGQWTIREDTYFRKTFPPAQNYTVSSNTYFVQPRFNGNVLYITPASNWHGTAKITVGVGVQTEDYYLRVIPVNDRPVIFPIMDQSINANQVGIVSLGGRDIDNDLLVFTATSDNNNLMTSVSGRNLTLTPAPDWSGTATITVIVSDGFLTDAWIFDVVVSPPLSSVQRNVAGMLFYGDNKDNLPGSIIQLLQNDKEIYETVVNTDGCFDFGQVENGYYQLHINREDEVDPITAADALLTAKFAINQTNSPDLQMQLFAADVDASSTITGGDALSILNKIIGNIEEFSRPKWITNRSKIGVGATDVIVPLKSILTGDVDASLLNNNLAKRNVLYKSGEIVQITQGEEIVVPVKVSSLSDFAAFDLAIKYDSENLEFLGVRSALGIMSNAGDSEIKLAWLNTNLENSINIEEGSTLLELRFNAKGELSKGYRTDLVPTKGEFVSKDGSKQNPMITISGISESTPMNFDLAQNYPNPFNPSTQISYSLPIVGQVELSVFNIVGERIVTLVNEIKEAGNHKVEWNADNIPSGVYFYTLNVNGTQNYRTTKKMLLLK